MLTHRYAIFSKYTKKQLPVAMQPQEQNSNYCLELE
jgi:hypothetical protein